MSKNSFVDGTGVLNNYKQLGAAVVLQAVLDYEEAIVEIYIRNEKIKELRRKLYNDLTDDEISDLITEMKSRQSLLGGGPDTPKKRQLVLEIAEIQEKLYREKDTKKKVQLANKLGKYESTKNRYERWIVEIEDFLDDEERIALYTELDPQFLKEHTRAKAEDIIDILKEKGKSEWKKWRANYGMTRRIS